MAQSAEVGKRHSKAVHMPEKSVINMVWLLLLVSDWPIITVGPGGLPLVVSDLFAVPILVLWAGLQKSKLLNLDVRNIFAGSHTEHCSKGFTPSSFPRVKG